MSTRGDFFSFEELRAAAADPSRAFAVEAPAGSAYFEGHFPGHPVLPAVAQLDILQRVIRGAGWPRATVTGVDGVRFRRMVAPASRFELRFEILRPGEPASFRFVQDGRPVSEGTVTWEVG